MSSRKLLQTLCMRHDMRKARVQTVWHQIRTRVLIPTPTTIGALHQPQLCYQLDVKFQLQFRTQNLPRQTYPNANPTSPPPTTTGAQTTTQTEAPDSES